MEMREPLTTETDAHNEINAARSLMTPGSCQVVMWPRASQPHSVDGRPCWAPQGAPTKGG